MGKFGYLGILFCVLAAPRLGTAATCTWTGGGADHNWSTAANWDNCGGAHAIPQNGDDLVFPPGGARSVPTDDIVGLSVHSVQITGVAAGNLSYAIQSDNNGIFLTLTGGGSALAFNASADTFGNGPSFTIATQITAATTIANLGTVKAGVGFAMDMNGHPLTLAATGADLDVLSNIGNASSVNTIGPHIVSLGGTSTFNGPVSIDSGTLRVSPGGAMALGNATAGTTLHAGATLIIATSPMGSEPFTLAGGQVSIEGQGTTLPGPITLTADTTINLTPSQVMSLTGPITGGVGLTPIGGGTTYLTAASPAFTGTLTVPAGRVSIDGTLTNATINVTGGELCGVGTAGTVTASAGSICPGVPQNPPNQPPQPAGALTTGNVTLASGATLAIDINSDRGFDQLKVNGTVNLANATLQLTVRQALPVNSFMTIIDNDGTDPVVGTFNGLPEGARFMVDGVPFVISYIGGTGNDVTLNANASPVYYLSEGSTGGFFDSDIAIANPNNNSMVVTVDFVKPDGSMLSKQLFFAPTSRQTVHVDTVNGMEATAFSTTVRGSGPLIVERSMFWDASYYAGSTGSAVDHPSTDWVFAEGSQGFFSTYVLLLNANSAPTDVTLTFLREADTPVVKTFTVGAGSRFTVDCSSIPEIVDRSFGITVHATLPITAERSMYFGTTPTRLWSGGHESAGVTAPATSWFLAEGATGGFFDTFVLLSNPQSTDAHVTVKFLLDTGDTVTETKVIPANQRLTINIEAEPDPRLANAAVSTVVTSDIPIVVERSMYWIGDVFPWTEAHNSFGVTQSGTHWGLSEGRVGGPHNFHTYILLANPGTTAANVTVTFLRDGPAPIVKTYTVPPTSRFNIDVNGVDPALHDEDVGAEITVTNSVPIVVERSMYWDSGGVLFKGGTNATGVRLP